MTAPRLPLNRRQFLTVSATMLGALAVRGMPVNAAAAAHFTHGVASGDPLQDRVILWTRVLPGSGRAETVNVQWQVASDQRFDNLIATGSTQTGPERDFTVKVDASGLQAGLSYFYRFIVDGVISPIG